ncbi:tripartite motif containing 108 [Periophthalmus magnuspinnatus]|uniref:tripartite motif containing 108 n=1 Tax=Periophthalmus magnuspinnatus TaxID=409849 RepID=UPI00145BF552|nr:tripartite motif containing 108 [Periophthalmus magnuspinnatus]
MASSLYAEDLNCPVCLCIFTEPVTLTCGHSFCRSCITALPSAQCPQCRAVLPAKGEAERLVTNHILKSLSEKAKEQPLQAKEDQLLCLEHDEKLKLFCVTDQRLACIICRDGEEHDGHKFKPIKEAAAALRRGLDPGLANMASDIEEIQNLREAQSLERSKAKELSGKLQSQIQQQFEVLHQHLRKREEQVIADLKTKEEEALQKMSHSLSSMDSALAQCTEQRDSWQQLLQVTDPEMFLKCWTEQSSATLQYKKQSKGLSVVQSPAFQSPFQSHLQFFMWKELLQVVEPRPILLTLQDDSSTVPKNNDKYYHFHGSQSPQTFQLFSTSEFSSGQHYWEVEVELRSFWRVGVRDYFLEYENQKYFSCKPNKSVPVSFSGVLRSLGVYLDCSSLSLSFYNAESMVKIVSLDCTGLCLPVSAYFNVQKRKPDTSHITICRY